MILLIILFNIWSVSNIIVHGTIFKGIRKSILIRSAFWGQFITCIMCTSLWIGFLQSLILNFYIGPILFPYSGIIDIFFSAFIGSGFSYIMDLMVWKFFIDKNI